MAVPQGCEWCVGSSTAPRTTLTVTESWAICSQRRATRLRPKPPGAPRSSTNPTMLNRLKLLRYRCLAQPRMPSPSSPARTLALLTNAVATSRSPLAAYSTCAGRALRRRQPPQPRPNYSSTQLPQPWPPPAKTRQVSTPRLAERCSQSLRRAATLRLHCDGSTDGCSRSRASLRGGWQTGQMLMLTPAGCWRCYVRRGTISGQRRQGHRPSTLRLLWWCRCLRLRQSRCLVLL
eukprot:COSAG06_NODE_6094_length_3114_cov_1.773466_4_plen_234_part_00